MAKSPKNNRKKNIAMLIIVLAVAVVWVISAMWLSANRTVIVINLGIRYYNRLRTRLMLIETACLAVVLAAFIVSLLRQQSRKRKAAKEEALAQEEKRAAKETEDADREVLSVSRKMDSMKIRDLLIGNAAEKWNVLSRELMQLKQQLDTMDEHQETLKGLLDANGAASLANTEDMLDSVEQYLCKNVRKALNYMSVADEENPKDVQLVRQKLLLCREDGEKQLAQVQEFLFALAEFLNKQGEDDNSMEMLDLYKSTILSSIKD